MPNLLQVLSYNTEGKGPLVDDFLAKYFTMVGSICSDSPAVVPNLIKNNVIPGIIESLSQRIPKSQDIMDATIFTINQISLHDEGQAKV